MMAARRPAIPERPRPRPVTVAYWLWVIAALLLIVMAAAAFSAGLWGREDARARLAEKFPEQSAASINSLLQVILVSGVVCAVCGFAVAGLARKVRAGDPRFRRALATLSAVTAILLLLFSVAGASPLMSLVALLLLIFASVTVYLPGARDWFTGAYS